MSRGTIRVEILISSEYQLAAVCFVAMASILFWSRLSLRFSSESVLFKANGSMYFSGIDFSSRGLSLALSILAILLSARVFVNIESLHADLSEICFITEVYREVYRFVLNDGFLRSTVWLAPVSLVSVEWAGCCSPAGLWRERF